MLQFAAQNIQTFSTVIMQYRNRLKARLGCNVCSLLALGVLLVITPKPQVFEQPLVMIVVGVSGMVSLGFTVYWARQLLLDDQQLLQMMRLPENVVLRVDAPGVAMATRQLNNHRTALQWLWRPQMAIKDCYLTGEQVFQLQQAKSHIGFPMLLGLPGDVAWAPSVIWHDLLRATDCLVEQARLVTKLVNQLLAFKYEPHARDCLSPFMQT